MKLAPSREARVNIEVCHDPAGAVVCAVVAFRTRCSRAVGTRVMEHGELGQNGRTPLIAQYPPGGGRSVLDSLSQELFSETCSEVLSSLRWA